MIKKFLIMGIMSLGVLSLLDIAEPVTTLLTSEPATPSVLIGHAFGNRVVRAAAYANLENVSGVILLTAGGYNVIDPKADAALKNAFNPLSTHKTRMKDVAYAFFAKGNDLQQGM